MEKKNKNMKEEQRQGDRKERGSTRKINKEEIKRKRIEAGIQDKY